jgi:hypothetical protein
MAIGLPVAAIVVFGALVFELLMLMRVGVVRKSNFVN